MYVLREAARYIFRDAGSDRNHRGATPDARGSKIIRDQTINQKTLDDMHWKTDFWYPRLQEVQK